MEFLQAILGIIYLSAGYWAAGLVLFHNKIVFHTFGQFFMMKLVLGATLGWILIPVAIIMRMLHIR